MSVKLMKNFSVDIEFWCAKTLRRKILAAAILPVILMQSRWGRRPGLLTRVTTKLLIQRRELARLMANQLVRC